MENPLPQRKNVRLENYDYSTSGAYFLTICTKERKSIFWNTDIDLRKFHWHPVGKMQIPTVSRMVKQFKGAVTKRLGQSVWQKSFIDHIIRDRADFDARAQYIFENPVQWYYADR